MLAESNYPNISSVIPKTHPPKTTSLQTRTTKRSKLNGTSSVVNIIGNTAGQAVKQAALRRDVRAVAPTSAATPESRPQRASGTPSHASAADPKQRTAAETMITYRLPVTLPRPKDMPMVTNEMLVQLDPDLNGVALPFVKDALQNRREAMLRGIASVDAANMVVPPSPTEVKVHMLRNYPNQFVVYPTHLICVSKLNGSGGGVVYPVNALVLVAHCARLPAFPPSASLQPDVDNNLVMPFVPLRLPHPESFSKLFDYLYTKNFGRLCAALCPVPPDTISSITGKSEAKRGDLVLRIVETIRETYEIPVLLEKMKFIHGLWSNVCELGIAEEGIWKCMNLAWQVLMKALSLKPKVETVRTS